MVRTVGAPSPVGPGPTEPLIQWSYGRAVPSTTPTSGEPEVPPDIPPEYVDAYLAGFRRHTTVS